MKNILSTIILICLNSVAFSQDAFWKDSNGKPVPNSESRSSVKDFGGWLLVTPDTDWRSKWETPSDTMPKFNVASAVERGKQIVVLTFFSNPKLTKNGNADVRCDIDVIRPNGSFSVHQSDVTCFQGPLKGNPHNLYLSAPIINFVGDPEDPAGRWVVKVTLKDKIRNVALPLKTSFILK